MVHRFGRLSELESRVNATYIDTINADVSLTNTLANAHATLNNALLVAQEEYDVAETAKNLQKKPPNMQQKPSFELHCLKQTI